MIGMRVTGIITILLLLIWSGTWAQSVKLEWAGHNTGSGQSSAVDIAVSDSGFVYVVGYFTDTVDLDPGAATLTTISAGAKDIFVQKLSPSGSLVWAKRIGGTGNDEVKAIAVDRLGNAFLTGSFSGAVDFNPGAATNNLTSAGGTDIFVQKLSAAGNYLWAYKIGGISNDVGRDIAIDAVGAAYITGTFIGTVNFNPGGTAVNFTSASPNFPDFFVLKISATPAYVWVKKVGGTGFDESFAITVDQLGSVYTTGNFSAFADFNPDAGVDTLFAQPSRDVFILKLNANGSYGWAKQLNGSLFASQGNDIAVDAARNLYVTGQFISRVDFDPGPDSVFLTPAGGSDPFVLKLDSLGAYVWARNFTGIASGQGAALAIDSVGSVYTTGFFSATFDFDPGADNYNLTTGGQATDVYISKLDSSGQFIWARNVGHAGNDAGEAIAVDTLGNVYFAGSFVDTVDFDPTIGATELIGADSATTFIAKWNPCEPTFATLDTAACYAFTSASGLVYDSSGVYREALLNASGCDSFIVINLTINDTARQTLVQTSCGSYQLNGQTYDSTGVYTQLFTSFSGCDSVLTLELIVNANVQADVTQSGDTLLATAVSGITYQWLDCNNGLDTIAGADGATFIPTASGDYALAVNANGCGDTSACFTITIVGTEEAFGERFALYPNPSNGKFTIVLGSFYPELGVTVSNLAGQTIWAANYQNQSSLEVDLDIPAGLYLITIVDGAGNRQVLRIAKD